MMNKRCDQIEKKKKYTNAWHENRDSLNTAIGRTVLLEYPRTYLIAVIIKCEVMWFS